MLRYHSALQTVRCVQRQRVAACITTRCHGAVSCGVCAVVPPGTECLCVITGTGHHSRNSKAKLLPAVLSFVENTLGRHHCRGRVAYEGDLTTHRDVCLGMPVCQTKGKDGRGGMLIVYCG